MLRNKRKTKLLLAALSTAVVAHFALATVPKAVHALDAKSNNVALIKTPAFQAGLADKLNQTINATGDIEAAVSVVDLDTGQQYDAGEDDVVFRGASTTKLIAVMAYLHQVEQGKATLSQYIEGDTAQDLIKRMLEVSDNNAWSAINDYLGDDQQAYAQSIGLTTFTPDGYNTISAHDEATLLKQLYDGKLINDSHREMVYSYMQAADGTQLIKAALPSDATVYHKYGMLSYNGATYLHDTAIVTYNGRHFALVIYTKDSTSDGDFSDQTTLVHTLTHTVVGDLNS